MFYGAGNVQTTLSDPPVMQRMYGRRNDANHASYVLTRCKGIMVEGL